MKQLTAAFSIFILSFSFCYGQRLIDKKMKLADFKFTSVFGMTNSEPETVYCLLGTGFFRAPSSKNSDSLIFAWIEHHPNAAVIPVSSYGPIETKKINTKMTYCWIVDQKDTLNNYLIRNGCFPGGTMMRSKESKNSIRKKQYEIFIGQIISAELYAKENKLGIWSEEDKK